MVTEVLSFLNAFSLSLVMENTNYKMLDLYREDLDTLFYVKKKDCFWGKQFVQFNYVRNLVS